jgi:sugar phosphate isomerase/epimerase
MIAVNRRVFLGTLGATLMAARSGSAASIERIGIQLYTVRGDLEKDFEGTIKKIAGIGYKEVEFAGYFGHTPQQVRDIVRANGLTAPSAHVDYPSLAPDKFPAVLEGARAIGHQFLVNPWIDETLRKDPDIWKRAADVYNRAGEASKKAGIQFAYHNHNFEFTPVNGELPFDTLLQRCDPALVKMELDLCWIAAAGKDPLDYFKKSPGRFPLVHVKGLSKIPAAAASGAAVPIPEVLPTVTDVGNHDVIDWKGIFAHAKEAGITHYFVEHDVPKAPFESAKTSYEYLKGLTF